MWADPVVEEVRRAREAYAGHFEYDLAAIVKDLRAQTEELKEQGWREISMPPKRLKSAEKAA